MLPEDLRYKFSGMRRGQFYQRQAKGCRKGSKRTSRRCWRRRSGLPAYSLQPFGLFCVWRLWVIDQCKASQQNRGPHQQDEGGDGALRQGHRGEGLLEVNVQDWGCPGRWQPFHRITWFLICPPFPLVGEGGPTISWHGYYPIFQVKVFRYYFSASAESNNL